MTSKHDILTALITVCLLAVIVVLVMTGHENTGIMTGLSSALVALIGYWFTRGGSYMAQQQTTPDIAPVVTDAVAATLDKLAQTPAQGAGTNAANVPGNSGH